MAEEDPEFLATFCYNSPAIKADDTILRRILGSDDQPFSPDVAKFFLGITFSSSDQERIAILSDKANEDALTPAEREELATYVLVGDFLTIAHSKAQRTLRSQTPAA